jgi:hypothetical protein
MQVKNEIGFIFGETLFWINYVLIIIHDVLVVVPEKAAFEVD